MMATILASNAMFALGIGVHYKENKLNASPSATSVTAGWRAPDVLLLGPGSHVPVRLQSVTLNTGAFWVIVFAGEPLRTRNSLLALRAHLDSRESFTR
jgi:phenol 2-monooxygenase